MSRGAEFSDILPRDATGRLSVDPAALPATSYGLNNGLITQVTPNNSFRLGQQVIFWLGIFNPAAGDQYITRARLKPWWARPNMEYRQAGGGNGSPGSGGYLPIDKQVFKGDELADNRYVWMPSPKRLDITEFQAPPPAAAVPLTSDSLMLDDVWTLDLQDATDPAYTDRFQTGQIPSRWVAFMYPAMGYALGFTYEAETAEEPVGTPSFELSLSWTVGTLGASNYQESIG
ncbi:MAG: hypothetical protein DRJ50_03170 [Actinobacteria bacterium]|nr:MAG: hypothetical protein DRJ50_03170 [Actinomycetota bacterium]